MSTAKQRIGFAGVTPFRRKLRNMHKHIENSIGPVIERGAQNMMRDMRARTPRNTGRLQDSIAYKLSSDRLTAAIGPGADKGDVVRRFRRERIKKGTDFKPTSARIARVLSVTDLFYFRFLDQGTKSYKPGDTRKTKNSKTTKKIKVNVPARAALHIKQRAFDQNKPQIMAELKVEIARTLARASELGL